MTPSEAKDILLLYRPGAGDARDPDVAAALALTEHDPELRRWFDDHCGFQRAMRTKLRSLAPPEHLADRLLAERKIVRPAWWRHPATLAAAAALVILGSLAAFWLRPPMPDQFADYRARMVRAALRDYRMDVVTNDMTQLRQFLATRGAPADYAVSAGLQQLPLTGGGAKVWRSNPVSMVCFDRGESQMVFLFVVKRSALKDAPPATPVVAKVNKLFTAGWSRGDKVYLLAGPEETELVQKFY